MLSFTDISKALITARKPDMSQEVVLDVEVQTGRKGKDRLQGYPCSACGSLWVRFPRVKRGKGLGNHLRHSCLWPAELSDPVFLKQSCLLWKLTATLLHRKPHLTDSWATERKFPSLNIKWCVFCFVIFGFCLFVFWNRAHIAHAGLELAMQWRMLLNFWSSVVTAWELGLQAYEFTSFIWF